MNTPNRSEFGKVAARAYFGQYVDGDKRVMNNPQVYYATLDNNFGSCSTLTPLGDTEVQVFELEEGIFGGDVGDDENAFAEYLATDKEIWQSVTDAIDEHNENGE